MSAFGPLNHIARLPLPWRAEPDLTECGRPLISFPNQVVNRDVIDERIKRLGRARTAYTICMTCFDASHRWVRRGDGDFALIMSVVRETAAVEYTTPDSPEMWARRERLVAELHAISALVEAHRGEFDAYMNALADTISLDCWKRRRITK